MTKARSNRKKAAPVRAQKQAPPDPQGKAKRAEELSRKAVRKAMAELTATVASLRKGSKLKRGDGVTGVVASDPAEGGEFAVIDWQDGEREGWNDKALKRGKVVKL